MKKIKTPITDFLNRLSEIWPEPENKKHHITRVNYTTLSVGIWIFKEPVYFQFLESELDNIEQLITNIEQLLKN
jgi:hypothetical protein